VIEGILAVLYVSHIRCYKTVVFLHLNHIMFGFRQMQILIFRTVWGNDLRVRVKFRRDQLNRCGVIASFRFPIWQTAAILDFFTHARDHQRSGIAGLYDYYVLLYYYYM